MRFQRVLLINPPVKTGLRSVRPNIGLGYLAQILLENHINYDVLDMLLGYSLHDLEKKIKEFKPDLLGVSMFSNNYKVAYEAMENIKEKFPLLKIVVGGSHASCFKEKLLLDCLAIDYGIILEGEYALLELCQGKELDQIKNLIYRDKEKITINTTRNFVKDLNTLPFPTYYRFELDKYLDEKSLISSRGCPHECIYCAVGVVSGKEVRMRSPANVVDEIEYWYQKGYKQFSFQDDNFSFYRENVFKLCEGIEAKGFKDICFRASGVRADKLDRELLKKMKKVGFISVAMGVEVGNNRMLEVIKKGQKFQDIDSAVKIACELGFDVQLNFLAGVPHETLTDFKDSIDFALKYPILYAEWFPTIPYPGTKLYDWLSEKKYLLAKPEEYLNYNSTRLHSVTANPYTPIFIIPELSVEQRKNNLALLKKIRTVILRRGIIRRLAQTGIPWGLRGCIGYVIASDFVSKYLFRQKIRNFVDKFRRTLLLKLRRSQ
jgi:radical SAM superfamily enzyme YgiQ (UPF0313 family)